MIRIIHLSDFHLQKENPQLTQKNLFQSLIKDMREWITPNSLIVISGDLVDRSGINFKDPQLKFDFFKEIFIEELIKTDSSLKNRIFMVPGNHDFNRTQLDEFKDYPLREKLLQNPETVERYIQSVRDSKNSLTGIEDYKQFEKEYYDSAPKCPDYFYSPFDSTFLLENGKIGVSAFNSSWLCYDDDDIGNILLGESQILHSLEKISDAQIKVAIIHHPFEYFVTTDYRSFRSTLYSNYDIILLGHTHKLISQKLDDLDGDLFISVGKSLNSLKSECTDYSNGYSIIDYFENDKIEVYHRKYVPTHTKFVVNTDIGNDQGLKVYEIPKDGELKIIYDAREIIENIKEEHFPKLNDDLILNISQSNKSKLNEVFVEPIIGNLPESNIDSDAKVNYFSILDLITSSENQIILGSKETGKTILLDKLLIDLTSNFSKTRRIPILLKFNEMGNKNINQMIRDFMLVTSHKCREILSNIEIDLLIDDLDFSESFRHQVNELKRFLAEYPNTRIVATINNNEDQIIPVDLISQFSELKSTFLTYYIHLFKSKQIKGLIANWVTTADVDVHQNIEKLLKGFREIGLPKTPLAVTIFLWIINKQENRPINNAVLVEMFVENLLEKGNLQNIYFDTFDFGDKQRLLAFMAKFMLDKDNKTLSYRVNEFELLKEIENYLILKIDINPNKVLEYLIERGVLIRCNGNSIRFKTAFFFSYFLAKYMGYDESFKQFVISDRNYLNYISELDFYTGLNREDEIVYDFIMKELEIVYGYINSKVKDDYQEIDRALETKETISSRIDLSKARQKPSEKEIDKVYDSQMSNVPAKRKIEAKFELSTAPKEEVEAITFSKLLKLASIVFKNSSDIDNKRRIIAYENLIVSSISYMMIYRDSVLYFYKNHREEVSKIIPKEMDFGFFIKILPIIHQVTVYNWLGSLKSAPVIRQKISKDKYSVNISEFEKFLSVYIYADIRGKDYPTYINYFYKNSKKKYILDSSFIKNMSYYYLRSKTEESDKHYTKLLADIKTRLGEASNKGKGDFIKKLKEDKKKKDTE